MNWTNAKLVFVRESLDQLRDRRMVFLYTLLPLLLYPAIGLLTFQLGQFIHQTATVVEVVGVEHLPAKPPLIVGDRFNRVLFDEDIEARLLIAKPKPSIDSSPEAPRERLPKDIDARLWIPTGFKESIKKRAEYFARKRAGERDLGEPPAVLTPVLLYDSAKESSMATRKRLGDALKDYERAIAAHELVQLDIPFEATQPPFETELSDIADAGHQEAAVWAKVFPLLLVVWALTGAFHPAVDLCAGEKERGTLETLLCSPASRTEIAVGKLCTIMVYSIITVVLNVGSMALTGYLILQHVPPFGAPPALAGVWIALALIPLSIFFSALCLGLGAFARSTAEGHFYMMPVFLFIMPLATLPMLPDVKMSLGYSLIPISGMVLMLRLLIEGDYAQVWPYVLPVTAVTLGCGGVALKWAVEQFNREAVLFREAEQVDPKLILRSIFFNRPAMPTATAALVCAIFLLLGQIILGGLLGPSPTLAARLFVSQLVILAIPVVMAMATTSRPREALQLRSCRWWMVPAAALLAVAFHPVVGWMGALIQTLYEIPPELKSQLAKLEEQLLALPLWQVLGLMAVAPAIAEEVAFRGFVLSGFRRLGGEWRAILISSLFFAVTHLILQQSLSAFVLGIILGYLALRSGSIFPAMAFHVCHNGLLVSQAFPRLLEAAPGLQWLAFEHEQFGLLFHWPYALVAGLLSLALLSLWHRNGIAEASLQPEEQPLPSSTSA